MTDTDNDFRRYMARELSGAKRTLDDFCDDEPEQIPTSVPEAKGVPCILPAHETYLNELKGESTHNAQTCGLCCIPDIHKSTENARMRQLINDFYNYMRDTVKYKDPVEFYKGVTSFFNETVYRCDSEHCSGENKITKLTVAETRMHFEKVWHLPQWIFLSLNSEIMWQKMCLQHMKEQNIWTRQNGRVVFDIDGVKAYKMFYGMHNDTVLLRERLIQERNTGPPSSSLQMAKKKARR